ncbi:SRPBCC family protein [uncultured Friedmanniella sp.]|uniref:SRPBCC family protein n=1 Tax=uncultured Friedmanniella sp. TaxID=335381 RepID=UPI0035CA5877
MATSRPTTVHRSGTVAAPVEVVFEAALSLPLPQLYSRRYGPIPPIVDVREQQGLWESPGQSRVFVTGDGGTMREEMLSIDRPHGFANRLTVLSGPFKPVVTIIEESWSFRPVAEGTEATWEWNLFARSAVARPLAAVVGRLWLGYAGGVLAQLAQEVGASGPPADKV